MKHLALKNAIYCYEYNISDGRCPSLQRANWSASDFLKRPNNRTEKIVQRSTSYNCKAGNNIVTYLNIEHRSLNSEHWTVNSEHRTLNTEQ